MATPPIADRLKQLEKLNAERPDQRFRVREVTGENSEAALVVSEPRTAAIR
jgi:hypothetical protein